MTIWRYKDTTIYNKNTIGTFKGQVLIRDAIKSGILNYREVLLYEGERLDNISAKEYGDSNYWWIIAAASNIGWPLQVTGGTIIKIPDLEQTLSIVYG
jgi:hypothetical protein